jgi:hypothetical protein
VGRPPPAVAWLRAILATRRTVAAALGNIIATTMIAHVRKISAA